MLLLCKFFHSQMVAYDEDYVNGLIAELDSFKYSLAAVCVVLVLVTAVLAFALYHVTQRESALYRKLHEIESK